MSDRDDEPGAVSRRSSVLDPESAVFDPVLAGLAVVSLTVLLISPALGGSERAAVTVGLVLTEATVLYVGYGALTRIAGPAVREVLGCS